MSAHPLRPWQKLSGTQCSRCEAFATVHVTVPRIGVSADACDAHREDVRNSLMSPTRETVAYETSHRLSWGEWAMEFRIGQFAEKVWYKYIEGPKIERRLRARLVIQRRESATSVADVLEEFAQSAPRNSRDWAADELDAALYAVLVGWGCGMECTERHDPDHDCDAAWDEVSSRHGWTEKQQAKLIRAHNGLKTLQTARQWRW